MCVLDLDLKRGAHEKNHFNSHDAQPPNSRVFYTLKGCNSKYFSAYLPQFFTWISQCIWQFLSNSAQFQIFFLSFHLFSQFKQFTQFSEKSQFKLCSHFFRKNFQLYYLFGLVSAVFRIFSQFRMKVSIKANKRRL